MNFRTCSLCKTVKPSDEFVRQSNKKDGYGCWGKACHWEKSRIWRTNNPEKAKETRNRHLAAHPLIHRKQHLRKTYGIEEADYETLYAIQEGRCAICFTTDPGSHKVFLCIDHIAGTTQIRGLLCSACNSGIGFLQHDETLLQNAIAYLACKPVLEGKKVPRGIQRSRLAERGELSPLVYITEPLQVAEGNF